MVSHFLEQVVGPKKLKGQAKGMVVTRNIESAIHYFHAVRDALKGQPCLSTSDNLGNSLRFRAGLINWMAPLRY